MVEAEVRIGWRKAGCEAVYFNRLVGNNATTGIIIQLKDGWKWLQVDLQVIVHMYTLNYLK